MKIQCDVQSSRANGFDELIAFSNASAIAETVLIPEAKVGQCSFCGAFQQGPVHEHVFGEPMLNEYRFYSIAGYLQLASFVV